MARPQSGLSALVQPFVRVQIFEVKDLPMNAMSVGQFSVWVPGLAHQILKACPAKTLATVVGFGHMFWMLAWHGKRPRRFQPFPGLEARGRALPKGEGDFWIYAAASDQGLIETLVREIQINLSGLARRVEDQSVIRPGLTAPAALDLRPIWIPDSEPDFARGCFLLQLRFQHAPPTGAPRVDGLHRRLQEHGLEKQTLLQALPIENGTLVLLFHQDPEAVDNALEFFWEQEDPALAWGVDALDAVSGIRFFLPSLDVLTGLRQGGIRMNRFSPTQQWDQ